MTTLHGLFWLAALAFGIGMLSGEWQFARNVWGFGIGTFVFTKIFEKLIFPKVFLRRMITGILLVLIPISAVVTLSVAKQALDDIWYPFVVGAESAIGLMSGLLGLHLISTSLFKRKH